MDPLSIARSREPIKSVIVVSMIPALHFPEFIQVCLYHHTLRKIANEIKLHPPGSGRNGLQQGTILPMSKCKTSPLSVNKAPTQTPKSVQQKDSLQNFLPFKLSLISSYRFKPLSNLASKLTNGKSQPITLSLIATVRSSFLDCERIHLCPSQG